MVKSDDLRVKRTRKLISQAFFTLLHKKKFEKISIQEIADSAMINRATFYAHYADKQDLYDSLIDQFLASFTVFWMNKIWSMEIMFTSRKLKLS